MNIVESILGKELQELENIINKAREQLNDAPKGHLRVRTKRKSTEYYYKANAQEGNGRYMRKREHSLAKKIAQRDYDNKILSKATKRKNAIITFLQNYCQSDLGNVFEETNILRRQLISPYILSDEEYVRQWQNTEYKSKYFLEDSPEIYTERGERVRSKSEKIIADKLNLLGIPYKYECPILLEGNIEIYPDFTILDVKNRREIYLEHFGLMDDSDYVDNVICKLNTYERNGIFLGVNLFITHETSKVPLNSRTLDKYLKALFGEE